MAGFFFDISKGNLELVTKAIELGANVDYNNSAPIVLAAKRGHDKVIDVLLQKVFFLQSQSLKANRCPV